jgi:hypothetical protein
MKHGWLIMLPTSNDIDILEDLKGYFALPKSFYCLIMVNNPSR